jgi:hypothetical protein
MAERQTKVYQGRQEQERDEAEAVAHGWRVVSRDSRNEGYKVTYERGLPLSTTRSSGGGIRGITWLVLMWNVVLGVLVGWRIATGTDLAGTTQQAVDAITRSVVVLGLVGVWLIGDLVLAFLWIRGRSGD